MNPNSTHTHTHTHIYISCGEKNADILAINTYYMVLKGFSSAHSYTLHFDKIHFNIIPTLLPVFL